MRISLDLKRARSLHWHEFAVRFLIGGLATVLTGLIAREFGPVIGGLFLSFPVIFPAGATLIEKHETQRKRAAGFDSRIRPRKAVSLDAAGASLGGIGLGCFGLIAWRLLPGRNPTAVLVLSAAGWLVVSVLLWRLRKSHLMARCRKATARS
jgi:hypothetical protein